jgi:hypothetical protein
MAYFPFLKKCVFYFLFAFFPKESICSYLGPKVGFDSTIKSSNTVQMVEVEGSAFLLVLD